MSAVHTVVFLGPSLPVAEARTILDAAYLPPAQQSDFLSAIQRYQPRVIGLIDGAFGQTLSVWHKEILFALDQGIHVYGASSMGALRAAETDVYGTVGVGQIYRMFASGELTDDDEVALMHAHDEAGYRPLSEAMVNIRVTLRGAREAGVLDAATHDRLIALVKGTYFAERSYRRLDRLARAEGMDPPMLDALAAYVRASRVDVKRADAIELLQTLAALPTPLAPFRPRTTFNVSPQFETLYQRDRRVPHDGEEIPLAAIATYAALHLVDFTERNVHALNRALVAVLGDLMGVEVTDAAIDTEVSRFRLLYELKTEADLTTWLLRNDLTAAEFHVLMREQAVARRLHAWLATRKNGERTTKFVLDELRLVGEYEAIAARAAAQHRLASQAADPPDETRTTTELVVEHVRATGCRMGTSYQAWAEEVGFHRTEDLRFELVRARRARLLTAETTQHLADALGA
jgi:hypothetical protein